MSCIKSIKAIVATSVALLAVPSAALAVPVTLTLDTNPIFQQTTNSPCVIGNPSCSNPGMFPSTTIPANTPADTLLSPTYTVGQIRSIVGNTFYVGIDLQEADNDYVLSSFSLSIANVTEFEYTGGAITLQNHGNGFSDYVLRLFDITNFDANAAAVFRLVYSDAQAAREQFFLAAAPGGNNPIPEPATMALLLAGLGGAALRRRS